MPFTSLLAFILSVLSVQAFAQVALREIPARFVFHDASEREGHLLQLQADTVHAQFQLENGAKEKLKVYKLELRHILILDADTLFDLQKSDFSEPLSPETGAIGRVSPLPRGNGFIVVESNPPDARVYVDGFLLTGTTPLLVQKLAPGRYNVAVRRFLRDVDWWGLAEVEVRNGDTARVIISLLKPRTMLKVQSKPTHAEVFVDKSPSLNRSPGPLTNISLFDVRPAPERKIHLFKPGYHDTVITVPVLAYMPNLVFVEMRAIRDNLSLLEEQQQFVNKRNRRLWGRRVWYTASLPLIASGIFFYVANADWEKAAVRARSYDDAALSSPQTDRLLTENRKYNRDGDRKARIAASIAGGALALGVAGLVLHF